MAIYSRHLQFSKSLDFVGQSNYCSALYVNSWHESNVSVIFAVLSYEARSLRPSSTVFLMGIIDVKPLTSKIS